MTKTGKEPLRMAKTVCCANDSCDSSPTQVMTLPKGGGTPLCDACAAAHALGQENPDALPQNLGHFLRHYGHVWTCLECGRLVCDNEGCDDCWAEKEDGADA